MNSGHMLLLVLGAILVVAIGWYMTRENIIPAGGLNNGKSLPYM
jgi:hypothetical protein